MSTTPADEELDKLIVRLIADSTKTWMPPTYEELKAALLSWHRQDVEEQVRSARIDELNELVLICELDDLGRPIGQYIRDRKDALKAGEDFHE